MKMNKILAAGVAASLAVTSLAAVASAAERTFDMRVTFGEITYGAKPNKTVNVTLDNQFGYKDPNATNNTGNYTPTTVDFAGDDSTGLSADTNGDDKANYEDFDAIIPVNVEGDADCLAKLGDFVVVIKGRKMDNGNLVKIEQKAKLTKMTVKEGSTTIANYILPIYYEIAPQEGFLANDFVAVDSIEFAASVPGDITKGGVEKVPYRTIVAKEGGYHLAADSTGTYVTTSTTAPKAELKIAVKAGAKAIQLTKDSDCDNGVLTIGGASTTTIDAPLFNKIIDLMGTDGIVFNWFNKSGTTKNYEAWLPVTDSNGDKTINRLEVFELSKTGGHASDTTTPDDEYDDEWAQSYDILEWNKGDHPVGFAGLASNVADFFNKQLNGTVTFYFTAGAAGTTEDEWLNGGIPSTEVGIKGQLDKMDNDDIALFVNYGSTTGSLQAVTNIDAERLCVEFDMAEILDLLGGQTIGTVQDVWYGMTEGITYADKAKKGFKVEKVVLAYDEDADDGDIVDGDEDDGDVDVEDGEDEGDVDVDDGEDEGDGEVDGDTDEDDFPTDEDEAGEDENPGTGVALAVVPAIMAAAAVVVSKKRK